MTRFNVVFDPRIDYSAMLSKILLAQNMREKVEKMDKEMQKEIDDE